MEVLSSWVRGGSITPGVPGLVRAVTSPGSEQSALLQAVSWKRYSEYGCSPVIVWDLTEALNWAGSCDGRSARRSWYLVRRPFGRAGAAQKTRRLVELMAVT